MVDWDIPETVEEFQISDVGTSGYLVTYRTVEDGRSQWQGFTLLLEQKVIAPT